MGDPFVAVDTGLGGRLSIHSIPVVGVMCIRTARILPIQIHGLELVAVTALPRVCLSHCPPDILSEFQPLLFELLRFTDSVCFMAGDLLQRYDDQRHLTIH